MSFAQPSVQAAMAAALLDPGRPAPPSLRAWNGSDPPRRFAVYRNNVLSSLVNALADTFPVVAELVGDVFFRAMGSAFVQAHPPQSPMLAAYGAGFADFIAAFPPAAPVPYLADVARLEMARMDSLHAADAEPLGLAAVQQALQACARPGLLRLTLHPSVRLLRFDWAAVSIWHAHQVEGLLENVQPDVPECAIVARPGMEVLVVPCDRPTLVFARACADGLPLADAASRATGEAQAFDPGAALALLVAHGALVSLFEDDTA